LVAELGVIERLREGAAALRPEGLDATQLLVDAAARFESRSAGQGVTVEVARRGFGEPRLEFTGDRLAAERILQNLVENALTRYSERRARLAASLGADPPAATRRISMSVTDDGPGFRREHSENDVRAFSSEPIHRAAAAAPAWAWRSSRELAAAHGGEAWARTVAPHGAASRS